MLLTVDYNCLQEVIFIRSSVPLTYRILVIQSLESLFSLKSYKHLSMSN